MIIDLVLQKFLFAVQFFYLPVLNVNIITARFAQRPVLVYTFLLLDNHSQIVCETSIVTKKDCNSCLNKYAYVFRVWKIVYIPFSILEKLRAHIHTYV